MKAEHSGITEHINSFPPETQKALNAVRKVIREAAPEAEETINYGIPTFKLNGNLVHFAGYKNHVGFYPGADGIAKFQKEISAYKSAKGSVQFPLNEPMPLDLIRRIVQHRVEQNSLKKSK